MNRLAARQNRWISTRQAMQVSNFRSRFRWGASFFLVAGLSLATGCGADGPPLAPVEGVITLNGKPLKDALVEFQPQTGGGSPSYGSTDQTGRYEMLFSQQKKGALVGDHRIRISTLNENEHVREQLPPEYHADSQIVKTVVGGETNVFNFEIEVGE